MPSASTTTRRDWLKRMAVAPAAVLLAPAGDHAGTTILLLSSWQSVNIGDVTHTTGILRLLSERMPGARVILWPHELGNGAEELLRETYPELHIVYGALDRNGNPYSEQVRAAMAEADLLLHSSSSGVGGRQKIEAWRKATRKPYGIFGVSVWDIGDELKETLSRAEFVFTRETQSLRNLHAAGVTAPVMDFVPDATFSVKERDDARALAFLGEVGLTPGEFIAVVPRLRYTPYHRMKAVSWDREHIRRVERVNAQKAETDHAKMREAMIAWVRTTGQKVLVCPEMTYQLDILQPLLVDPLPEDVKRNVVRRETFWRPDEAASVYERARAVISAEAHSPIIAMTAGTPAFYVRQPEDTIKGQMYYDLGLSDWVFEVEQTRGEQIAARLMEVHRDHPAAVAKANAATERARALHARGMGVLKDTLAA